MSHRNKCNSRNNTIKQLYVCCNLSSIGANSPTKFLGDRSRTWDSTKMKQWTDLLWWSILVCFWAHLYFSLWPRASTARHCQPSCGEERKSLANTRHSRRPLMTLQLELHSNISAANWSSLERIASILKIQYEGKTKLSVAKHNVTTWGGNWKIKRSRNRAVLRRCEKSYRQKKKTSSGIKDNDKSG